MILWASAFQPLIKVVSGTALGIGYEYIYLFGRIEPHFKTDFGSYLALSAWKRMIFHLSGTLGSALGAALVAVIADERLRIITRKAHRAEANSAKCVLLHSPRSALSVFSGVRNALIAVGVSRTEQQFR
jgi:hypothetical protein